MPETSAWQCWQSEAAKSHRLVGFGCSCRCAPACGLLLGLRCSPSLPLCPRDGGVLELSGFFGGRLSFASRPAALHSRLATQHSRPLKSPIARSDRSSVPTTPGSAHLSQHCREGPNQAAESSIG